MGKSELVLQFAVFGIAASIIGLLVLKVYPNKIVKNNNLTPPQLANVSQVSQYSPPTSITISSVNLHLPVATGVISNNQWTLYDDKVSWLATSKTPGEGNVILYAHNREKLFANLAKVTIGDRITVGAGEKIFTYQVSLKQKVAPSNVDIVLSKNHQLTLYTCDGSFDQKRLIVIATPTSLN